MQIITTHKGTDFDAMASVLAAKMLSEAVAVLPRSLNPNVKAFMSTNVVTISPAESPEQATGTNTSIDWQFYMFG